jgi:hypothetical protein
VFALNVGMSFNAHCHTTYDMCVTEDGFELLRTVMRFEQFREQFISGARTKELGLGQTAQV